MTYSNNFNTEIKIYEEEIPVLVEYSIYGKYIPATRYEPEEFPDLEVTAIWLESHPKQDKETGKQKIDLSYWGVSDEIIEEAWKHADETGVK